MSRSSWKVQVIGLGYEVRNISMGISMGCVLENQLSNYNCKEYSDVVCFLSVCGFINCD